MQIPFCGAMIDSIIDEYSNEKIILSKRINGDKIR